MAQLGRAESEADKTAGSSARTLTTIGEWEAVSVCQKPTEHQDTKRTLHRERQHLIEPSMTRDSNHIDRKRSAAAEKAGPQAQDCTARAPCVGHGSLNLALWVHPDAKGI